MGTWKDLNARGLPEVLLDAASSTTDAETYTAADVITRPTSTPTTQPSTVTTIPHRPDCPHNPSSTLMPVVHLKSSNAAAITKGTV